MKHDAHSLSPGTLCRVPFGEVLGLFYEADWIASDMEVLEHTDLFVLIEKQFNPNFYLVMTRFGLGWIEQSIVEERSANL